MRRVTIAVLALAVLSPLTLYAQEWSSAQKAVWAETHSPEGPRAIFRLEVLLEFAVGHGIPATAAVGKNHA